MLEAQRHAREIRNKFRNPEFARVDHGINLKHRPIKHLFVVPPPPPEPFDFHNDGHVESFGALIEFVYPDQTTSEEIDRYPSMDLIVRVVCAMTGRRRLDLFSQCRNLPIARARQTAMYLAREMTLQSHPSIGRFFGKRDHTTSIHSYRKIKTIIDADPEFAKNVASMRDMISSCVARG
jgi:ATPase involved in DNA replication initiation